MSESAPAMTSNRPYLLRALNEWINDHGMTPYLLVDARREGVEVPASSSPLPRPGAAPYSAR